jgi:uncharacterized membrane protein
MDRRVKPGDDNCGGGVMSVDAAERPRRRLIQWGAGLLAGLLSLEFLAIGWLTPLSLESWIWLGIYRGIVFHAVLVAVFALVSVFGLESRFWLAALGAVVGFLMATPIVIYAGKLASDSLTAVVLVAEPLAGAMTGYLWSKAVRNSSREMPD